MVEDDNKKKLVHRLFSLGLLAKYVEPNKFRLTQKPRDDRVLADFSFTARRLDFRQ